MIKRKRITEIVEQVQTTNPPDTKVVFYPDSKLKLYGSDYFDFFWNTFYSELSRRLELKDKQFYIDLLTGQDVYSSIFNFNGQGKTLDDILAKCECYKSSIGKLYLKPADSDVVIFVLPFPHVEFRSSLALLRYLDINCKHNIVFMDLNDIFFSGKKLTKEQVDKELRYQVETLLESRFKDKLKVVIPMCMGYQISSCILDLFDLSVSYAPMVKRVTDKVIDPKLYDFDYILTVYFYWLFNLLANDGNYIMSVWIKEGFEKVDFKIYTEYFNAFICGSKALAKKNVVLLTLDDVTIDAKDSYIDSAKTIILKSSPRRHGSVVIVPDSIKEFVDLIEGEISEHTNSI